MPLDWTGETVLIVASGPSAGKAPLELARGRAKVIAVNSSWRLVPWADILFACDSAWWFQYGGCPEFKGRKITSSPVAMQRFKIDMFAAVGNNSGKRAIDLAEKLGSRRVLLIGFEMHTGDGIHWHDRHPGRLHTPGTGEMAMWRGEMEKVGPKYATRGVTVINCTPGSALKCFPYLPFEEALNNGHDDHASRADQPGHCAVPG